ncbi:MAG: DJ-1/PfpI family protein [Candidatus Margulisbacteria bacterium]|nr:DJ-1/PfpI family protein [Candidatus Margulisiibacteriota bacterium]
MRLIIYALTLTIVLSSTLFASGEPAPKQSKYKLEVIKMELVPAKEPQTLTKKKVLMVIPPQDFHDKELSVPKEMLEAKGATVTIASSTTKPAKGMYGLIVTPEVLLKDAKVADYNAVVFVGGTGTVNFLKDPQAPVIAREANQTGKIIGAICIAPSILAKAHIIDEKKVTGSSYCLKDFKNSAAEYTGKPVEKAGKIITGQGPNASQVFGQAIVEALEKI